MSNLCDCLYMYSFIFYMWFNNNVFLSWQTLSLTCTVCGDPKPQVSWLKSGAEVEPDDKVYTLPVGSEL